MQAPHLVELGIIRDNRGITVHLVFVADVVPLRVEYAGRPAQPVYCCIRACTLRKFHYADPQVMGEVSAGSEVRNFRHGVSESSDGLTCGFRRHGIREPYDYPAWVVCVWASLPSSSQ